MINEITEAIVVTLGKVEDISLKSIYGAVRGGLSDRMWSEGIGRGDLLLMVRLKMLSGAFVKMRSRILQRCVWALLLAGEGSDQK